jgi:hypothetical protein
MRLLSKFSILVFLLFSFVGSNAQQLHAHWEVTSKKVSDCECDVIFKVKIDKPWHMYSMKPVDGPNPTSNRI